MDKKKRERTHNGQKVHLIDTPNLRDGNHKTAKITPQQRYKLQRSKITRGRRKAPLIVLA